MDLNAISNMYFDERQFDKNLVKGIPYMEMKDALEILTASGKDLNRLGIKDFEFVKCELTSPLKEVQRSIFPSKKIGVKTDKQVLKLDRNGTYMIDWHFAYKGVALDVTHTRVPLLQPGGKFVMWGKNNFVRSVLVDRGVNLAKNELYVRLDKTSFSMSRTTHPFYINKILQCETVLIGNPHVCKTNKTGKGHDKIRATQNLFLYLLAKKGWKGAMDYMGVDLELVEGDSYDDVYSKYYPQGYTVFGPSGFKTGDGGLMADWYPPKMFILYKGDLTIGSEEHTKVSMCVANFYYIADRIPVYLNVDIIDDTTFWCNILGRFIFYTPNKTGQWYSDAGLNHLVNSMDILIDERTRRRLAIDEIVVDDAYELFTWLIINEREVYANVHPSDVSRKRITTMRYLLSYIIDDINTLGYNLLGRTDADGNFKADITPVRLNKVLRTRLKEGTMRSLTGSRHNEVVSLESPSSNMFITNTRALLDQTKVKSGTKEHNHMYNKENFIHASKMTRCRMDGIDSHSPSGATQINPLSVDMSTDTALTIEPWLEEIEAKLTKDLQGEF